MKTAHEIPLGNQRLGIYYTMYVRGNRRFKVPRITTPKNKIAYTTASMNGECDRGSKNINLEMARISIRHTGFRVVIIIKKTPDTAANSRVLCKHTYGNYLSLVFFSGQKIKKIKFFRFFLYSSDHRPIGGGREKYHAQNRAPRRPKGII